MINYIVLPTASYAIDNAKIQKLLYTYPVNHKKYAQNKGKTEE